MSLTAIPTPRVPSNCLVVMHGSKWDNLHDDDDEGDDDNDKPNYYIPPDMTYIPRNIMRQHQHFVDIRQAGGVEMTNDLYVREPNSQIFWFVGKIARVSDVSLEDCVARQWKLIEQHAANLRPLELSPKRGVLEIWTAPGDSELDIAYNRPHVIMQKMKRMVNNDDTMDDENTTSTTAAAAAARTLVQRVNKNLVGFQGEMYDPGEEGFRTWRTDDGKAAKPEVMAANPTTDAGAGADPAASSDNDETAIPSQEEMDRLLKALDGMDVKELYKEQERREGRSVEE